MSGSETGAIEIIAARDVPLGGPRAIGVRRTLPSRHRTTIGAWCFVDHFGPDRVEHPMSFPPHPHTGLQTVSWLFSGELRHRDSAGYQRMVRSGELNLMTAGRGISHSEVSSPGREPLHGAQLWIALPDPSRHTEPGLDHYAPPEIAGHGWSARVFLGGTLGSTSPIATHTPLVGAELRLDAATALPLPVDPAFEHGVLLDAGSVRVDGDSLAPGELGYLPAGRRRLRLETGETPARVLLLGGVPFGERIVMWWNFIGRSHEEIEAYRTEWHRQIVREGQPVTDGQEVAPGRFGVVAGESLAPIPAPTLPNSRMLPRG
ncbi:MAG: pirin family protein [Nocardioides sp.]